MQGKRGFTLIELLVVIAIIAVLMAILMPALRGVQKQAKGITCQAHLKQWGIMFALYADDHNGSFNPGWDVTTGGEHMLWPVVMRPYYLDNEKMLVCPMATKLISRNGFGPLASWERDFSLGNGFSKLITSSYCINSWTNNMKEDRGVRKMPWFWKTVNNNTACLPDGTSTGRAVNRNNIPVFLDGTWNDAWPRDMDAPPTVNGGFETGDQGQSDEMNHFCITRHDAYINGLFMDWTVRKVGLKELWTLKWHRSFNTANIFTKAGGAVPEDWPLWMRGFRDF